MVEATPIGSGQGWFRGDDFIQPFNVVDGNGTAVNITGWLMDFTVKRKIGDTDNLVARAVGTGIALVNPTAGALTVTIPAATTAVMPPGNYFYALRRTDSGFVQTIAFGPAVLLQSAAT